MRQEYIEVFLEIVNTKNLTKAAENLHLTQSTVSQQLKLLEQELGVQLILRNKGQRAVELTAHGIDFVPMAENWMVLLQQTENLKRLSSHELFIGAVDSMNMSILPMACQRIMLKQPAMNLNIITEQSNELYQLAGDREIDLGFVSYRANYPHVFVYPVFEQKMCIIRNCKNSVLGPHVAPSDLHMEDEIRLGWGRQYEEWHDTWWATPNDPHVAVSSMLLLQHFLQTPDKWAVVPRIDFDGARNLPLEICDLGNANPPNRQIYMIEPHSVHPSHCASALLFKSELELYVKSKSELIWNAPEKQNGKK